MLKNMLKNRHWCLPPSSKLLDYSIRDSLTHFISTGFYGWTGRGGSSSMVSELRSWVQFPLVMHFFLLSVIISTSPSQFNHKTQLI
jgi:hypothetical protein